MRTKRVVVITLDSGISDDQFHSLLNEWEETVDQAACDNAANAPDDRYEVAMFVGTAWGGSAG